MDAVIERVAPETVPQAPTDAPEVSYVSAEDSQGRTPARVGPPPRDATPAPPPAVPPPVGPPPLPGSAPNPPALVSAPRLPRLPRR